MDSQSQCSSGVASVAASHGGSSSYFSSSRASSRASSQGSAIAGASRTLINHVRDGLLRVDSDAATTVVRLQKGRAGERTTVVVANRSTDAAEIAVRGAVGIDTIVTTPTTVAPAAPGGIVARAYWVTEALVLIDSEPFVGRVCDAKLVAHEPCRADDAAEQIDDLRRTLLQRIDLLSATVR